MCPTSGSLPGAEPVVNVVDTRILSVDQRLSISIWGLRRTVGF
jgi:hypothetical protein